MVIYCLFVCFTSILGRSTLTYIVKVSIMSCEPVQLQVRAVRIVL